MIAESIVIYRSVTEQRQDEALQELMNNHPEFGMWFSLIVFGGIGLFILCIFTSVIWTFIKPKGRKR
jgi:hypothetical protein